MSTQEINEEIRRIDNALEYIETKDYWSTADRDRARDLSSRKYELQKMYPPNTEDANDKSM